MDADVSFGQSLSAAQHDTLRRLLWDWLHRARESLLTAPIHSTTEWRPGTPDGNSYEGFRVPDIARWVNESRLPQSALPSTDAVVAFVLSTPAFAEAFLAHGVIADAPIDHARGELFAACLAPLAIEVLRRPGSPPTVSAERFDRVYAQLIEYVYNFEKLEIQWMVHLSGIQSEVESVQLSENIWLRHAGPDDRQRAFEGDQERLFAPSWTSNPVRIFPPRTDPHLIPDMVVEVRERHRLPRNELSFTMAKDAGDRAVEALRLLGPGSIVGHTIWLVDQNPFGLNQRLAFWFDGEPPSPRRGDGFVLSRSHATELPDIWKGLRTAPGVGLALARRRLADSYRRDDATDRLLDYWIGLEALFLGNVMAELKFRAALRIATYLGDTSQARQEIFELARKSYDLRSRVAHGEQPKLSEHLDELIESTGDLLRRAVRQSVVEGSSPVGADLDRTLLD